MTGWGQDGPYASAAGHGISYINSPVRFFTPTPGDTDATDQHGRRLRRWWDVLAFGVVCALLSAQRDGRGQVVDAAMVDGTATLMTMLWSMMQNGLWNEREPGTNLLDTGAHFYDVYECGDGKYVSIGSIEPQFYAELLQVLGLPTIRTSPGR